MEKNNRSDSDEIVMKRTVYIGWNDDKKQYRMKGGRKKW